MQTECFLIDTSVWIFVLRKNFIPQLKDRIDTLLKTDTILTTGIIKLELFGGTRTELEYLRLKKNLSILEEIETNSALWEASFNLSSLLRRKGVTVPYTDIIIAACAQTKDATILHADANFDLIKTHTDIKVESYVSMISQKQDSLTRTQQ